jgi:hypothetical protein
MKKMGTGNKMMTTVQCTICGMDMDCPESMLPAERHFCARCTDLMAEGYEPDELKKSPEDIAQHFENESLARDCYLQGATSMLGLLISAGMPPEFLDELAEGIRGAKRRMGEGK